MAEAPNHSSINGDVWSGLAAPSAPKSRMPKKSMATCLPVSIRSNGSLGGMFPAKGPVAGTERPAAPIQLGVLIGLWSWINNS